MEPIWDLFKIIIPAGIVLYAMFLTVKTMLQKQNEAKIIEIKAKNKEIVLPIRLQAYERMSLFLERISPDQIIKRVQKSDMNVAELQYLLLNEIREEFNHNLSQQVYMSDEAWKIIKNAKEELIMVVNQSAKALDPEAKSIELVKRIYEESLDKKIDNIEYGLSFLKNEIQQEF
ncbi:hypothetical protein MATR_13800 [Marivirga tractuosa]|uniref:Uncharacterized protein n=1 Tax=Marivirga tractuosa (strain ATCC 23168 / DSM 4126 / NBRC 15989 / NCIMB 1408 / VKM B-1430 / H-43) TaxID=643867 RepID=E4TU64_MARTH|nr:hypothetical protein [Marivirga tractuosa]ADR20992.1 hypothetical protein Ftrac_0993 [Marivirga tractuosa DSM 4126]BDD14555.1 hypothetical protein MATR_13800 [Marivirga tractuosa]